jgi:hypothetical protein
LVTDISQHRIELRQGFTGAQLLLFGAIMSPDGASAARDYDVVVVLEGPARQMVLREKQKVAGMWVNAEYTTLRSVPSFYAVVANRPIREITDPRTAAIYQLGLDLLQLSPSDSIDPARETHFAKGLVDLMQRQGLFHQDDHGVTINGQVLYSARINLPSSLQPGTYTAETLPCARGGWWPPPPRGWRWARKGLKKRLPISRKRIAGLRAAGGGCLGGDGMDGRAPVCLDLKKAKLSLILTYCPHFRSTMTGVRISTKARLA